MFGESQKVGVMIIAIIAVVWVVFGVFAYGLILGDWTHSYPDQKHYASFFFGIISPAALFPVIYLLATRRLKYFRLRPLSRQQRWSEFERKFPLLAKEDPSWFDK